MEYIEYSSRVEFRDNIISHNVISSTSSYDGGGLYLYTIDEGSTVWMTGNQINDNIATGDGGGFYMDDYIDYGSVFYFEHNELQRNWAGDDGGGCYFDDYWYDGSVVHFNHNLINDNTALGDYGGCHIYYIDDGTEVTFIGNEVNGNTAGGDYGGLYFEAVEDGAVLRFWDNQVISNRAGIVETALVGNQVVYTDTVIQGGDGGGIYLDYIAYGGEVDFRRNQILENTAYMTGTTGGNDSGLYAYLYSNGLLTMVGNVIAANEAQHSFAGLAVDMYEGSRLVLEQNEIRANTAFTDSGGIYIYGVGNSQYFLRRNKIVGNSAAFQSGLWLENGDTSYPLWGRSENNLIAGNTGGVYLWDADFHSTNDTIADNGAYGVLITGTQAISVNAWLTNAIVWDHTDAFSNTDPANFTFAATYSDIEGGWAGTGNINADPLFVGGGDYHLQATSPVIDQADAAAAPARDLDNVPRPVGAGVDMGCYEFRLPGVSVTGDGLLTGDPGTWVTHAVTITNDGNAEDAFDLSLSGNSWTAHLSTHHLVLADGDSVAVDVTVYVPDAASAGDSDSVDIDAVSTRNALVVDSDSVDTEANLVPNVYVYPDNAAGANAGSTQIYHHVIENLSNGAETFDLSVVSSQGWSVQVLPPAVTLGAGLTATVEVRVIVPAGAGGLADVTTLTATSISDGSVADSATDTTLALNHANIAVAIADDSATIGLSDTHVYSFTLTNAASVEDTFSLTYTSSAGWVSGFGPNSVTLGPGAAATIYITVTAPAAGAHGDVDITIVNITSGNDGNVQENVNLVTTLRVLTALTLTPDRSATLGLNETRVYTHTLTNAGDQADTIAVAATSSQGWLVDWQPKNVTLGAGASATVYVTVTTPAAGNSGDTDLTRVTATSGNDAAVKDSASAVTVLYVPPETPPTVDVALVPNNAATVLVGSVRTYTHTLTNNGDATDVLTLSVTSDNGWAVTVQPGSVTLAVGASAPVTVTVTTPASGPNGLVDIALLQAASANAGGAVAAVAADVTTLLNPASILLTADQQQSVPQGATAIYTHTLTNNGARVDTFTLSANSSQSWITQLSRVAVTLEPGASAEIVLQVHTPADAAPDTIDSTTLRATSAYGAAAFASNVDTTTVTRTDYQIFLPLTLRSYQ